jgi:hypothetical protein
MKKQKMKMANVFSQVGAGEDWKKGGSNQWMK